MKRDTTGKFIHNWDNETKQRVSVTLTATAWQLLDEQAKQRGISRSEMIEQMARSSGQVDQVAQADQQPRQQAVTDKAVNAEPTRTELALRKAERRVVSILESISDGFVALDRDWHYTYVNQAAAQLLEKAPEALLGKHLWNEVFPNLVGQLQYQELHRAASEQIAVSWEEWSESVQRWLEVNAYPTEEGIAVYFRDITERKHAEVALRESEEKLRLFIQQAPVSVAMLDKSMYYITASQRWVDFHKLESIEAVIGRSHYELLPNLPDNWKQVHQRSLAGATERCDDDMFVLADGSIQYLRWEVQPWYVSSGNIGGIVIFSEDITERKRAEQALRESEERYRTIVHTANEGIWLINSQAQTLYSNDRMAEMLGYTVTEMLERTVLDCCFAEDITLGQERIGNNLRGNKEQFDFRFRRKDDSELLVLSCTSPVFDGQGNIVGALGMFTDVTARQQAEAALRNSAERLSVALAAARLGDWSWEAATDLVNFSERAAEIFGIPPGPYMTWTKMQTLLHEADREQARSQVEQAIADRSDYDIEYRVIHPDGREYWVAAKGRAQYDAFGQVLGMLGVVQDITDRKQAEQEREQLLARERIAREEAETANRIKDEFLAVLSHELRSPLNPILGWAKLLRTRQFDQVATKRALETIERNAKLQTQLIDDLLDVSRILRGKMALNVCSVDLVTVIDAALETVRLSAEAKAIEVKFTISEALSKARPVFQVSGDASRLQQIVWNILSNAVKFTPVQGHIEIQLEQVGNDAQIQVSDTGKGITPEFLPYVFEYFRQEDSTTTRRFGGLGLGLAIVRYLTELHGGTVTATSPGEGLGATFTVRLPLKTEEEPILPDLSSAPVPAPLTQLRVLVVDDEADMRHLIFAVLGRSGAETKVAASAAEALSAFDAFKPDILISDIGMPEMDGYMLMQQIRRLSPEQGGRIPAIALSAYAGEYDQQQALASGFQQHISKPVDPEELVRAIAVLLNRQRQ